MKKVKFTATPNRRQYTGKVSFTAGQVHELDDIEAARLVKTWPVNFSYVEDKPEAKALPPKKDKSVKPKRDKAR